MGKILTYKLPEEESRSDEVADEHTYTDAKTLKKSDISTEELEHLNTVQLPL